MDINQTDAVWDAEEPQHRYIIGIDLGTTNSAVAYIDLSAALDASGRRPIHTFAIPQLVAPGELGQRLTLPSFLYLPGAYDLPPGSTALPWDPERAYVVGELAREQGARVPDRLVGSAKSWLSHAGIDRTAPILRVRRRWPSRTGRRPAGRRRRGGGRCAGG